MVSISCIKISNASNDLKKRNIKSMFASLNNILKHL